MHFISTLSFHRYPFRIHSKSYGLEDRNTLHRRTHKLGL
ncbi:unnamed protein product [Haemonchus placei]|uniref:Uncharacterized protein n=1 Tax=Haemonchus placei TaxID=6290 RepID=A0A0N4VX46_HAEPC|nr:unnamed protein product [Haemonchus placei]